MTKSIDECPVRGCGAWVPGLGAELVDDEEFECRSGHLLHAVVLDGDGWLEPFRSGERGDGRPLRAGWARRRGGEESGT